MASSGREIPVYSEELILNAHLSWRLAMLMCCLAQAPVLSAAEPASATQPGGLKSALTELTSDDFTARENAVKTLRALIVEQTRQQVQVQQVMEQLQESLGQQVKQLAVVQDPEAHSRSAGLLEMQASLTRWALDVMTLPLEHRKAILDWGFTTEAAPVLTRIYSRHTAQQRVGIKELGKLQGDGADWTLAELIRSRDDNLSVPAMAAAYDRPPTDGVIEALWQRAIEAHVQTAGAAEPAPPDEDAAVDFPEVKDPINVKGEQDLPADDNADLATIVLLHYNTPRVAQRLTRFIDQNCKDRQLITLFSENDILRGWCRLVEKYHVKEAIPALAELVFSADDRGENGDVNGLKYWTSTRTEAIGTIATLTGQHADDYKLNRMNGDTNEHLAMWVIDNEEAQKTATEKFRAWWKDHHKEYGVEQMPATAPAETPESVPAPAQIAPPPPR
jgi:hypothetical protein